ncbi:MAG TPA: hypothetical protein VE991_13800 [Acidimicrobiales bacterium]|nr:hypothetical protein [Acidimicrobiales bacterium]
MPVASHLLRSLALPVGVIAAITAATYGPDASVSRPPAQVPTRAPGATATSPAAGTTPWPPVSTVEQLVRSSAPGTP